MPSGGAAMSEVMYRPPFEAGSFLLEVTKGCSHNRCSFCTMYRGVPFRVLPDEAVEQQLEDIKPYAGRIQRVFLENGDPFALNADRLLRIAEMIHWHLPAVETIAMYASVKNIQGKTDTELAALRKAGINELNIGVESGLDRALAAMDKGSTAEQARFELLRLRDAGIDWGANVIYGGAGAGNGLQNAEATAALLNETRPYLIFTGTIHADAGCPLYDDLREGRFAEPTIGEYLDEEERFLSLLDLDECFCFGLHPSNIIPVQGWLPQDKEKLMQAIRSARTSLHAYLNKTPIRGGEGAILYEE